MKQPIDPNFRPGTSEYFEGLPRFVKGKLYRSGLNQSRGPHSIPKIMVQIGNPCKGTFIPVKEYEGINR